MAARSISTASLSFGLVERKDLVRGFEVEKGEHVAVEDEELEETAEEKRDDMGIIQFVPVGAINPLLHEHDYYLAPAKGADQAYAILARALASTGRVVIDLMAALKASLGAKASGAKASAAVSRRRRGRTATRTRTAKRKSA